MVEEEVAQQVVMVADWEEEVVVAVVEEVVVELRKAPRVPWRKSEESGQHLRYLC